MIIYHHNKGAPAIYIATALKIPAIATTLIPAYLPTSAFRNPFLKLGRKRHKSMLSLSRLLVSLMDWGLKISVKKWVKNLVGLGKIPKGSTFKGYAPNNKKVPRFHLISPTILPKPNDWPASDVMSGYCFTDRLEEWSPPEDLSEFLRSGPPPIYIGFGSLPVDKLEKLSGIVIKALKKTGQRGVLMVGDGQIRDLRLPKTIYPVGNIPHDYLFPQCAAIVHHGGVGTVHQSLRWGKPSVICPMFLDQPFWGEIVHELGAGPSPLKFRDITADSLASKIESALQPACVEVAQKLGQQIREEDGPQKIAEQICIAYALLRPDK